MRRTSTVIAVGLLAVAGAVAFAGTVNHTSSGDWNNGTLNNINTGGGDLDLAILDNLVGEWYRTPFDGVIFDAEIQKDDGASFSDGDRCLTDADNGGITGTDTVTLAGDRYRTGTTVTNIGGTDYVSTLPTSTTIALPNNLQTVDFLRFTTGGARLATTSYTVRFHYPASTADVVVPIAVDTVTGAARNASGVDYDITGINALVHDPDPTWDADGVAGSDCAGNGGDAVVVTNPNPGQTVTDIEFIYPDYNDAAAATGWLGGPFAVTVESTEADIESTFSYTGEYISSVSTGTAVDAGSDAIWYQVSWQATVPAGSEGVLYFSCGDDTSGNGNLEVGELSTEQVIDLTTETSPFDLVNCNGQYAVYRLELLDEFTDNPQLDDVNFIFDPDVDGDGFGADGTATAEDCDDFDAGINPGVTEVIGDGIDQNCNGTEDCWEDYDEDGARSDSVIIPSADNDCNDLGEGLTSDPVDCNDSDGGRFPGNPEVVGDGIDQDCDLADDCWFDGDRDGHGDDAQIQVTSATGTCLTTNQEATVADDCDDGDNDRFPGNPEVIGDGVDQDCNNRDRCYEDLDQDGFGSNNEVNATAATCQTSNQEATVDGDCDDGDNDRYPTNPEVPGDNKDQDCDFSEECFTDQDNDGFRLNSTFTTVPGDTDCTGANEGEATDGLDCLDTDNQTFPGATEVPGNNVDNDCNGLEICYFDQDDDGYRISTTFETTDDDCTDPFEGEASDPPQTDCDDGDDTIFPGATEVVGDNIDSDCTLTELCYDDIDNDGAKGTGTFETGVFDTNCTGANEGELTDPDDCDDSDPLIKPGVAEIPGDNVDQDCNNREFCYTDADNDGARLNTTFQTGAGDTNCTQANEGEASDPLDCDDGDDQRSPLLGETTGNNKDNDCNDEEICWADADLDNARHPVNVVVSTTDHDCFDAGEATTSQEIDCNDGDNTIYPSQNESDFIGNEVDNDCDGGEICYLDNDQDGFRHPSNTIVSGDPDCQDTREAAASEGIDCDDDRFLTNPNATDVCGNGIDDNCDGIGNHGVLQDFLNDDDDGLSYAEEQLYGTDDCDADTDNDNLDDHLEVAPVLGTDPTDPDTDGDTINDGVEVGGNPNNPVNSDGDGLHNALDPDDDDDTIPTSREESDPVGDGDGVPNYLDLDSDNDGWSDDHEWNVLGDNGIDEDGDGDPNYVDLDSDDDTVPDSDEENADTDGTEGENRVDDDDDGDTLLTADEDLDGDGSPLGAGDDWDGDGINDYLDDDDDDDLVDTRFEGPNIPLDTDSDGNPNYHDTDDDGDGIPTALEDVDGDGNPRDDDTDFDGIPDYLDGDDDNDMIPSDVELSAPCGTPTDFDEDGVPNHLDDDSDGDGFSDLIEWTTGIVGTDHDGDGCDDYVDLDSDDDTVDDADERAANTDGQGGADRIDNDDDGDTLLTQFEQPESQDGNPLNDDSDGDGDENFRDPDDDDDNVDTIDEIGDPTPGNHDDFDGDGDFNYLDTDDDNDGEDTVTEDPGNPGDPHNTDTDGDGDPNYLDIDDDDDGILTIVEAAECSYDFDNDGTPNHLDSDSDADGWTDLDEGAVASDGDLCFDFVDTDSDNDSVDDDVEGSSGNPVDTDGDGLVDRIDTDDDDDQIPTFQEWTQSDDNNPTNDDWDGDGDPDYLDPDDDNDGVLTFDEDVNQNGDPRDDNTDAVLQNPDGVLDYLDTDDDGDGIPTIEEDPNADALPINDDTDGDGTENYRDEDDDGDTLFTFNETLLFDTGAGSNDPRDYDFDADGTPNFLDADDDDDLVDSLCEVTLGNDHLNPDVDGDTFLDGIEWYNFLLLDHSDVLPPSEYQDANGGETGTTCLSPWDRDSDGIPNARDPDDDGDGLLSGLQEGALDLDCLPGTSIPGGDLIPEYLDWDSDGDGLLDDIGGDGVTSDGILDGDGDSILDFRDCDDSGCAGDADRDGILNCDEAALPCPPGGPPGLGNDWCNQDPDMDKDGVIDGIELGTDLLNPNDTDGDTIPDYIDTDDDGDGFDTLTENRISCGVDEVLDSDFDPDLDYWHFDCDPQSVQRTFDFGGNELTDYPNTDAPPQVNGFPLNPDDIPDFLDVDDDGDGVDSADEGIDDDDGDGIPNYLDPYDEDGPDGDPDGDGLTTAEEQAIDPGLDPYDNDSDGDGLTDDFELGDPDNPTDSDGDGLIDAVDADDDGDGIDTIDEGVGDPDRDGVPNYLDDDSDGDGKPDSTEVDGAGNLIDDDCDNIWDFLDDDETDGPCRADTGRYVQELYERQGCGCASEGTTGAGAAWLLALGLIGLRRRRRAG